MPIYEYKCAECGKVSSFLLLSPRKAFEPTCKCGSKSLCRLMSRFAAVKSEDERLENMADPSKWGDVDESDPKSMARALKRMGKEMGEDVGEDFDQIVDEAMEEESVGEHGASSDDDMTVVR